MLLIDSIYINDSGGKVLLDCLVRSLSEHHADVFYLLDKRCEGFYNDLPKDKVIFLKPSLIARHRFYKKNKTRFSKILCFANIPPSIQVEVPVYTYFHNILLLEQPKKFPARIKFLLVLKKFILVRFLKNTDYIFTQSENSKNVFLKHLHFDKNKITVLPFYRSFNDIPLQKKSKEIFGYISNGNSHKNHYTLLKAWEILYHKGYNFELYLTISDNYPDLVQKIESYKASGLRINNVKNGDVKLIYQKICFLVYPSLTESFGLPMVEAVEMGCEVIGANLPYLHAIIDPLEEFNPLEAESIAEAVIRGHKKKTDILITKLKIKNQISDLVKLLTS